MGRCDRCILSSLAMTIPPVVERRGCSSKGNPSASGATDSGATDGCGSGPVVFAGRVADDAARSLGDGCARCLAGASPVAVALLIGRSECTGLTKPRSYERASPQQA